MRRLPFSLMNRKDIPLLDERKYAAYLKKTPSGSSRSSILEE